MHQTLPNWALLVSSTSLPPPVWTVSLQKGCKTFSPWGRGHGGRVEPARDISYPYYCTAESRAHNIIKHRTHNYNRDWRHQKPHMCSVRKNKINVRKGCPALKVYVSYPTHFLPNILSWVGPQSHVPLKSARWHPIMENIGSINFHNLWGIEVSTILAAHTIIHTALKKSIPHSKDSVCLYYSTCCYSRTVNLKGLGQRGEGACMVIWYQATKNLWRIIP